MSLEVEKTRRKLTKTGRPIPLFRQIDGVDRSESDQGVSAAWTRVEESYVEDIVQQWHTRLQSSINRCWFLSINTSRDRDTRRVKVTQRDIGNP